MRKPCDRRAIFIQLLVQACLLSLLTAIAQAQSGTGSQQITQSVVAGGGGSSAGGSTQVDGTAGQSVTGTSSGGSYTLESGFWAGASALTPSSLVASDVTGTYGGAVSLSATLTSNGANLSGKLITFSLNGTTVGTANTDSNGLATLNNVSLSGINAGTYPSAISAQFAGDAVYAAISAASPLTIQKATPVIIWSNSSDITYGTALSSAQLNATVNVPGTFVYLPPAGTVLNAGSNQTLSVGFTPTDTTNYNTASANVSLNVLQATQTITFGALSNRTYGDADFNVSATASSGLSVTFTATGQCTVTATSSTVHITGAGSCTITAAQAGNGNFNAAVNVSQSFSIAQATTTTTVTSSLNPANFGQGVTFTATVASPAGTPSGTIQFKDNGTNLGSSVTLNASGVATFQTSGLSSGTHTITADYSGDTNFAASTGTLAGGQGVGTQPTLSINDVTLAEGNSGITSFTFTITLSAVSTQTVTVNYATADGTATAGSDYQAASGTLTFAPGDTTRTITASVNGDTQNEPDETFMLTLSNASNATLTKAQGVGTVLNDDVPGIQLSAATYTVGEGDGRATFTVTRSGDLSQSASVNYATADQSGLTPCQVITGLASQRCDYGLTIGLLRFAAGETTKTITIPIVDDSYTEGAETFTLTLSNPQGVTLGANSAATITIVDNDVTDGANPLTKPDFFIRQHYLDFLNREPEPEGLAGWLNILNTCPPSGADARGIACDRIEVSSDFYRSEEFQTRGYFIYRFYAASLGRIPRYAEFMPDMARVSGFLTTMDLETMKTIFVQQFMTRAEFNQKYGATQNDAAGYVKLLEQTAGVTLSSESSLITGLENGTETRATVLRKVIESQEVGAKLYNEAFVVEAYFGYLRRDPDSLYQQWIQRLNQTGDYRALVNGFLNSNEYVRRFGP